MIFCANIENILLCLWTLWLLCFEVQSLAQGVGWLNDSQVHSNSLASHARSLLPSSLCLDPSHVPVLAPATLAALPSTRAIPNRDVFYGRDPSPPAMSLIPSAPLNRTRNPSRLVAPLAALPSMSPNAADRVVKLARQASRRPTASRPTQPPLQLSSSWICKRLTIMK